MNIGQKYRINKANNDDNMVPLINVVFLMLVFFMVAGQIKKSDPIDVTPPHSVNDKRAESNPNVEIVVGMDGTLYVDDQLKETETVSGYLESQFASSEDQEGFWVQIKADGGMPVEQLRPIFNQVRLAGLTKVSISTQLTREQL